MSRRRRYRGLDKFIKFVVWLSCCLQNSVINKRQAEVVWLNSQVSSNRSHRQVNGNGGCERLDGVSAKKNSEESLK
jgi:hypothetical protein